MFTHWSALTCWVDGRRLLRLQNRLEMMASTRDELSSESGSNVFSPFSLKDSMMFQMSTRDTEKKQWIPKYSETCLIGHARIEKYCVGVDRVSN